MDASLTTRDAAIDDGAAAVHALSAGLLRDQSGSSNLVLSPYSVASALGLALAGARGRTATQIASALGGADAARTVAGLGALGRHLAGLADTVTLPDGSKGEIVLSPANALFAQAGVAWDAAYLDALDEVFGAQPHMVDFAAGPEAARRLVNAWVARHTADRISELVPAGAIGAATRLVLVNAIHFAGSWARQFEEGSTSAVPFAVAGGPVVEVPTMRSTSVASGAADVRGSIVVRVPYAGRRLALTLVLPPEGGEQALLDQLGGGAWTTFARVPVEGRVDVRLPRWEARTQVELAPVLRGLGVDAAFAADADFGAMSPEQRLKVDAVVHEGWIKVDETGTEAAAATAVVMRAVAAVVREEPRVVAFDRPFAWCLHDVDHGVPIFAGWVADPRE